ncbi:MAG: helix-turn-helix transcriptional regulator [Firmicutes bacterium]|nr:helix-turn-helix transcriptional regulator [Bacillota bacterium]
MALWFLAQTYPGRRVFGLGLGFSLLLIGLSTALAALEYACGAPLLIFLTALVLLFLFVPVLSRNPFQLMNQPEAAPAPADELRTTPPVVPEGLTPAETKVYQFLIEGAGDAEIAEALFISRHTVKFHVRNVLRKLEVKNRRELIVQTLAGQHRSGDSGDLR